MAVAAPEQAALRREVRRLMNQALLTGEGGGDLGLTDDDLDAELLAAARHLAAVLRADALGGLVAERHPASLFDGIPPLRVLGSRVTVGEEVATRFSRLGYMTRSSRRPLGTLDDPVYVAQDGTVDVYADGRNPSAARVAVVTLPQSPLDLPEKVRHALVLLTVAECWAVRGAVEKARAAAGDYAAAVAPLLRAPFQRDPIAEA